MSGNNIGVVGGRLLDVGQERVDQVQGDPVEHDAGNDLVDVAVRLEDTGDRTDQSTGQNRGDHARQPAPAEADRAVDARAGTGDILSGCADIEEPDLIGKEHGQAAHEQRRGLDQGHAQVFDLGGRFGIGPEILDNRDNGLTCAGRVNDQQRNIADQEAEKNTYERGEQCLDARFSKQRCTFLLHRQSSFLSLSLLAPAM